MVMADPHTAGIKVFRAAAQAESIAISLAAQDQCAQGSLATKL
jgi:hypothetical protein